MLAWLLICCRGGYRRPDADLLVLSPTLKAYFPAGMVFNPGYVSDSRKCRQFSIAQRFVSGGLFHSPPLLQIKFCHKTKYYHLITNNMFCYNDKNSLEYISMGWKKFRERVTRRTGFPGFVPDEPLRDTFLLRKKNSIRE